MIHLPMLAAAFLPLAPLALAQGAPLVDPTVTDAPPPVSLEQEAALRCSAAFALVSAGQERGNEEALQFPPLAERGKEYFVRSMAQVMDDTGMTREQVSALVGAKAQQLWDDGEVEDAMPACLLLLDASGL